jgi:Flp pilus assembly protein TadG
MVLMSRSHDEDGAIAIVVAICSAMLLVLCAMVVDVGLARDTKRQSQNAADASALAAANAIYLTNPNGDFASAVAAAKTYATANFGVPVSAWSGCVDAPHLTYTPDPTNSCISFDATTRPTRVRVVIPTRNVPTSFAAVVGVSAIPISAEAGAKIPTTSGQPCGLCLVGTGLHDFQNGDVTVADGNIYLNGSTSVSNNGLVSTNGQIYVEGYASGPSSNYQPDPNTLSPRLPDPLAGIVLPPAGASSLSTKSDPCTDGPGIYGGVNLNGRVCVLTPGLYVITSGTWDGSGNTIGELRGSGVTLYFTCASGPCVPGQYGARLDASGNFAVNLQAPATGPLQGLSIVYDRNNAAALSLTGNGNSFTGTIYALNSVLEIKGNGCSTAYQSMIVVKDVTMAGNGTCLKATYQVGQNPIPAPGAAYLYQ